MYSLAIYHSTPPHSVYSLSSLHDPPYSVHAGRRGGVIYSERIHSVSIPFLFLLFLHQSSLYPIKIFAKCFYLLVCILFSAPYACAHKYEREDRSMIAHVRDECTRRVLLTSFIVGTI